MTSRHDHLLAQSALAQASAPSPATLEALLTRVRHLYWALLIPLILAIGWEVAVLTGAAQGRLLPPPSKIIHALWALAVSGELLGHIGYTSWRVLLGFALGAAAGTFIGAAAGYSYRIRRLIDPSIQALRAIPSLAWVPLFILWLGIFEASKIALIAVGVFFPVYLGVCSAVLDVDRKTVEVGRIFQLKGWPLVQRILLPAILPNYVLALRTGLGLGWMFVVAAEIMGASQGLGYLLVDGQQLGKPDQILAAIITFAIIGKISDALIVAATAPLLRWQDTSERH